MIKEEAKFTAALANSLVALGFNPPTYKRPKWYQFQLKKKLAYYDKNNWPYKLI